ncbi:hypothetical protein IT882_12890 [Microbacterium schleiferi]|uniref:Uncharacterized protein n=1 Tax=Microbacterium schleiferi TaxID=69362 RepID=A0A7S8MVQ0_9MICO|nr:hypothetical protein [Microbacterium schleiferi]QPE04092.1 hypothetical protein IT882_12890 [Microbacterium schleiferi]
MTPTPAQAWESCDWSGALALRQAQGYRGSRISLSVVGYDTGVRRVLSLLCPGFPDAQRR